MVRSDNSQTNSFVNSDEWETDVLTGHSEGNVDRYQLPKGQLARMSFSGSERNNVFVRSDQGTFVDVSGVSGLDSTNDSRCVAVIDQDRDGLNDILVTNANKQTLNVFRNRLDTLNNEKNFVAVRVVGGNHSFRPSTEFTSRDGTGALIRVSAGSRHFIREVRCGEGLATQNSQTYIFGLDTNESADSIEVKWPSGKKQKAASVDAGTVVVFNEIAPAGDDEHHREQYSPPGFVDRVAPKPSRELAVSFPIDLKSTSSNAEMIVVTAMATWCDSCKSHLKELDLIRERFRDKVQVVAIPVDDQDSKEKLDSYLTQYQPAYDLLPQDQNGGPQFIEFALETIGTADIPFTAIVSRAGRVLKIKSGFPTVSDLNKAMRMLQEN